MFHQEEDFATKNFGSNGLDNGYQALETALFMNLSSTQQKKMSQRYFGSKILC